MAGPTPAAVPVESSHAPQDTYDVELNVVVRRRDGSRRVVQVPVSQMTTWEGLPEAGFVALECALHDMQGHLIRFGAKKAAATAEHPAHKEFLKSVVEQGPSLKH